MAGTASDGAASAGGLTARMDNLVVDPRVSMAGEGVTPLLNLDGFSGPLELLLALARTQRLDLAQISLPGLLDQLAAAMEQAAPHISLGQKADWVVMAAWLLQLRARLLLPAEPSLQQAAQTEATRLRDRLFELEHMQALAAWLERRPQLGRDVFGRGQPEFVGTTIELDYEVDVVGFLWASLALFEDPEEDVDTATTYRPIDLDLYSVPQARDRILAAVARAPETHSLDRLLPEGLSLTAASRQDAIRRRSAWTSTLIASLELAKQGDVALAQDGRFAEIRVCASTGE